MITGSKRNNAETMELIEKLPSKGRRSVSLMRRKLTPLTQKLLVFAFVNIVIINCLLLVFHLTPWRDTPLHHLSENFVLVKQGGDSWGPMSEAYLYTQNESRRPLYSEIFFNRGVKFQYPPSALLVISALSIVRNDVGFWFEVLKIISWVFVIVMAIFTFKLFEASSAEHTNGNMRGFFDPDFFVRGAVVICLTLTFYPVIRAYSVGQIQVWISSLFAIVLWCWINGKKGVAGVLVGIICLIKPQFSPILIWGLFRSQWRFTTAFAATALVGFLLSISIFGVADQLNYLQVLSFISRHGESYYANQSINGFLNRLLLNGNILVWQGHEFPAFNPWVYAGTTISSLALISTALFWPVKANEKGSIADFAIIALTCTIAFPIAWIHYYGILLPIYAFLLPSLLKRKIFGWVTITYLAISYVLASNNFVITKKLAYTPLNISMSYLLAAGLMVLVCLYFVRSEKHTIAVA